LLLSSLGGNAWSMTSVFAGGSLASDSTGQYLAATSYFTASSSYPMYIFTSTSGS